MLVEAGGHHGGLQLLATHDVRSVDAALGAGEIAIHGAGAATIAEQDIVAWKTRLAATLPEGAVDAPDSAVDVDVVTGVASITIRWDDSKGEEDVLEFVMRTRL